MATQQSSQTIIVKPRIPGFFFFYILFALPGFILNLILLFVIVVLVLSFIIGGMISSSSQLLNYRYITQNTSTTDKILVYNLTGAITSGSRSDTESVRLNLISTDLVERDFRRIKDDKTVKGVVFRMNTPGGSIFASEVLGDLIARLLRDKDQNQAVFYFDRLVASGGLWASYKITNNYVVGSPYGETGSIGVLVSVPNISELANKVGYSETVIKSSQSKDIGNPLRDLSPDEQKFLQGQVNDKYNQFVRIVSQGRKIEESKVRQIANGFVYDNASAKNAGLIDELGDVDIAVRKVAASKNIKNYSIVEVETLPDLFSGLFGEAFVARITGIDSTTTRKISASLSLEPGVVYAIDHRRY